MRLPRPRCHGVNESGVTLPDGGSFLKTYNKKTGNRYLDNCVGERSQERIVRSQRARGFESHEVLQSSRVAAWCRACWARGGKVSLSSRLPAGLRRDSARMPVRRGHVAPQNTFLDTIIRKFESQSKLT